MKLRRILIENVRSFLEPQELIIPADVAIIIGPNGGGKTNLLDTAVTILRLYILKSWVARHRPNNEWQDRYEWGNNESINANSLEKHSSTVDRLQRVELDLEITPTDIANILRTKSEAAELHSQSKRRYTSYPSEHAANWNTDGLVPGKIYTFRVRNNGLEPMVEPDANTFLNYLQTFEINSRLRSELEKTNLSTPMLSLPVNRSAGGVMVSISLADFNEHEQKRSVDAASSRASGSIISLAIGRLAGRYRDLLEMDNGTAKTVFTKDSGIETFTKTLKSLGYDWSLECTNTRKNQYDIRLNKQGSSFLVGAASSGEREILTYLFAIYALNVRDALIVIDEPELHLHPRWQKVLLQLFEKLSTDTGNQFVMATHSPVFVSPASIQYVSRVSSENQQSRIVRLGNSSLPEAKHLFNIVNSQNNERLFFADKVILVEGISDRIFVEALLKYFSVGSEIGTIHEVVSVGGKTFFEPYQKLLNACQVSHVIIADLDFVNQVGTPELRALFTVKSKDVKENVVDDPASIDAQTLVARMDEAIQTKNLDDLARLWEYIKGRQRRLRTDLSSTEQAKLDEFITSMRSNNLFILSRGALEAYLPLGFRDKDLDKIIRLTSTANFWELLPSAAKDEWTTIFKTIFPTLNPTLLKRD